MADKDALGMIGLMLCTVTVLVMMVGALVVGDHLTGRLHIEGELPLPVIALPAAAR